MSDCDLDLDSAADAVLIDICLVETATQIISRARVKVTCPVFTIVAFSEPPIVPSSVSFQRHLTGNTEHILVRCPPPPPGSVCLLASCPALFCDPETRNYSYNQ